MASRGIRDFCKYISQTVDSAAEVMINVNNNDANMHINIPLYQSNAKVPNSLGLMFTLSEKENDLDCFGKGTYLNYYKEFSYFGGKTCKNQDGSMTTFILDSESYIKYKDKETQTFLIIDPDNHIIFDKYGNQYRYIYDKMKYPSYVEKVDGGSLYLDINSSWELLAVSGTGSDGVSETITFNYYNNTDGYRNRVKDITVARVSSIIYKLEFFYDSNGYLSEIISTNDKNTIVSRSKYDFNFASHTIVVKDEITGYRIKYFLDSSNTKVLSFKDGYTDDLLGGKLTSISYLDPVTSEEVTIITDYKGNTLRTYFDNSSYPTYEVDNKGRAIFYSFAENENYIKPTAISNLFDNKNNKSVYLYNKVKNGYFESDLSNWIQVGTGGSATIFSKNINDFTINFLGTKALSLYNSGNIKISQEISFIGNPGEPLTFLIWGKESSNINNSNELATVNVRLKKNGSEILDSSTQIKFNKLEKVVSPWQYRAIEINAEQSYDAVLIELTANLGVTFLFDGIQIYKKPFGKSFLYDIIGNEVSSKSGNITTYNQYSNSNLVTQAIGPDSTIYNIIHNTKGQVESKEASFGVKSIYTYDNNANITSEKTSSMENTYLETNAQYNLNAGDSFKFKNTSKDDDENLYEAIFKKSLLQLEKVNDPDGAITNYNYDTYNNLNEIQIGRAHV